MSVLLAAGSAKRGAQLLCAIAALFMVVQTWRAIVPASATSVAPSVAAGAAPVAVAAATDADISATVSGDLFSPDRSAPAAPYRLVRMTAAAAAPTVPLQQVQLIGTVINANGRNFAMCQIGAGAPQVVYVGQRIGSLTLVSVSQGSALFMNETGARVILTTLKAGS